MQKTYKLGMTLLFLFVFLVGQNVLSAQIVNVEERRITGTNDTTFWYGSARFSFNLIKVEDQVVKLNGTLQLQFKHNRNLWLLLLDGKFLRAGNQDFKRTGYSHLRYNFDLTEKLVLEAFLQAQADRLLLIELRALAGTGLRYRLLKNKDGRNRMYGGLAYLYERNRFLEDAGEADWHRVSTYISFTVKSKGGVRLTNTTYFQPQVSDFENQRFSTEWRLETPLSNNFSIFTDFAYNFDKSVPDAAPEETYNWINGLSFKF